MWKDFFYYSKSERRAILFLLGMGILLLVYGGFKKSCRQVQPVYTDSMGIDSFLVKSYRRKLAADSFHTVKKRNYRYRQEVHLKPFDPNLADSAELCRLGLPPFLARRIVNYRKKGGVFHRKEDFARIYGLSEQQYQELYPYLCIAPDFQSKPSARDTIRYAKVQKDSLPLKYPEGTVLDLNAADTTQLMKVPGIGSGLAKMIVTYRNRLGGFASVAQLQELAYLDSSVNRWFAIRSGIYRPLKVNKAGLDVLRNHPYMNFYRAKAILEYRRKRGKITGLSQLSLFQEFTEEDLLKLKPYLDFE